MSKHLRTVWPLEPHTAKKHEILHRIFTDEYLSYNGISRMKEKYGHKRIRHASKVYVMATFIPNTIEGFWSLVKRGISGVYHSVRQNYLQSYLNEYSFRCNRRDSGNLILFAILAKVAEQVLSKPFEPVA